MNEASEILSSIYKKGARVWIESVELRYHDPQGVLDPEQLDALQRLRDEVATLIESQLVSEGPPIPTSNSPSQSAPLTFQQEVFWSYLKKYNIGNGLMTFSLRLLGELNVESLRRSIDVVIRRHESLRTKIVVIDETPTQQVNEPCEYELQVVDVFGNRDDCDVDDEVRLIVGKFFSQSVDLTMGPLFEVRLIRLRPRDHVLAVAVHHIISDGMSAVLLLRELTSVYGCLVGGIQPSLPHVPLQYPEYAIWQRCAHFRWWEKHGDYWNKRLAGAVRLRIPADHGVENVKPYTPAEFKISFGEAPSRGLMDLARRDGRMPGLVMLALFSYVASCWCNQRDFVIPFTVSGRHLPEQRNMMGFFAQALLLRIEMTGDETFRDLLKLVTKEFLSAHEHLDFGSLFSEVPDLYRGSNLNWLPWNLSELTEVIALREGACGNSDLKIESFPVETKLAEDVIMEGELGLAFWHTNEGIAGGGCYRADLFTANTVQRFSQDLLTISELVIRDPCARLASFPAGIRSSEVSVGHKSWQAS